MNIEDSPESCVRYLIVVVSTKEYRYEGQPDDTGGVHCEAYVPATHGVKKKLLMVVNSPIFSPI